MLTWLFKLFCCYFFQFFFLNALQSDDNSNRVYVLGHKHVLGPSQAHFKMSLSRAQNMFMPANINSIVLIVYNNAGKSLGAYENTDSGTGTSELK